MAAEQCLRLRNRNSGCLDTGGRLLGDLKLFCSSGNIVGTRYLLDPGYHFSERCVWALFLFASFGFILKLMWLYFSFYNDTSYMLGYVEHFKQQPLLFPTIGICEVFAGQDINLKSNPNNVSRELEEFLRVLVYQEHVEGLTIFRYQQHIERTKTYDLSNDDYANIYNQVLATCTKFLRVCSWQGIKFNCCSHFQPILTLVGSCFILQPEHIPDLNMSLNGFNYKKQEQLGVHLGMPAQIFLLTSKNTPEPFSFWRQILVNRNQHALIEFVMQPTTNEPQVLELPMEVLGCQRLDLDGMEFGTCLFGCVRHLQLNDCNCISWNLNATNEEACSLLGYVCLESKQLYPINNINHELLRQCECLLNCNQNTVFIRNFTASYSDDLDGSAELSIQLIEFPRNRLQRQRVRRDLDGFVSFGGIVALSVGCSFLSVLELFFITLHRLYHGAAGACCPGDFYANTII